MSKTLYVEYRNAGFWAYDVAVGIFLKHLIDAAGDVSGRERAGWLVDCIERWRVNAVVSDFGLYLDDSWSDDRIQIVLSLLAETCKKLEQRALISAEEMEAWDVLDGRGIFACGDDQFPTVPVIELGQAIQALLVGALPAAPDGTWWCYGTKAGRTTIAQRN